MPALDLMSSGELARLDVAISAIPDSHLRDKAGLLLMRQGILPAGVCRLTRIGFTPPEPGLPAQVVRHPRRGAEEITILPQETAAAVMRLLRSHDSPLIIPDMGADHLTRLLAERLTAAEMRQVSPAVLRNSVRLATLAGDGA
ncbi:hypothetical protein ACFV42_23495 [Streptomyces solisilvae]|uniref:hypothetical protein n=1 Tax=Streptomyces malaysiensis TaxID=92644 RepID=UPI0036948D8B